MAPSSWMAVPPHPPFDPPLHALAPGLRIHPPDPATHHPSTNCMRSPHSPFRPEVASFWTYKTRLGHSTKNHMQRVDERQQPRRVLAIPTLRLVLAIPTPTMYYHNKPRWIRPRGWRCFPVVQRPEPSGFIMWCEYLYIVQPNSLRPTGGGS